MLRWSSLFPVLAGAIAALTTHPERMRGALDAGMMATDLADYLVARGVPFREAHSLSGQAVQLSAARQTSLDALPLAEYRSLHPAFDADVYAVFDPEASVARRSALGGTAPQAVQVQIEQAHSVLAQLCLLELENNIN
jgi:argininosuccinate lyase